MEPHRILSGAGASVAAETGLHPTTDVRVHGAYATSGHTLPLFLKAQLRTMQILSDDAAVKLQMVNDDAAPRAAALLPCPS